MRNVFKLASFLFYALSLICFFFIGLFIAKYTGAGENQGLAGGAIVLFYGIVTAGIALIVSVFAAYSLKLNYIITLNKILGALLLVLSVTIFFLVKAHQKKESNEIVVPPKTEIAE